MASNTIRLYRVLRASPGTVYRALFLLLWLMLVPPAFATQPTEVMMLATIHGLHKKSTGYPYERVYELMKRFRPDYIGVEIRPEDMQAEQAYLESMYPAEIIHEAHAWGKNAFGFDWLGYELEGIPVPSNWWKSGSKVKRLEAEMDKDSAFKDSRLDAIDTQRKKILEQATPQTMNDRHYDHLNDQYYSEFARLVAGTHYDFLSHFYLDRDHHMALNIAGMIKEHPGARIIVLTSADHRSAIVRYLQDLFGDSIHLVAVSNQ